MTQTQRNQPGQRNTTGQWECNWQRSEGGQWQTRTFDTREQAEQAAEDWANWGAWNANWQHRNPGPQNCPAWTQRDGERRN